MLPRFFGFLFILILSSCASVPDSIQVAEGTQLTPYEQVAANPAGNTEKTVRWGGVIAKVENLPDQTMFEMVHYPLRDYGRPVTGDESVGRFRVYVDSFLDPVVYEQGRAITFTGKVIGSEEGAVGEHKYMYPTMVAEGYHLWKNIQRVEISTHVWPYHHWYGYYGYPLFPVHQRVIIKTSGTHHSSHGSSNAKPRASSPGKTSGRAIRDGRQSQNIKDH